MTVNNWFIIDNVNETDTPFLAIFPERVKANIRALKELIPDTKRLRPHVKTNKCQQAVTLMQEAGISKFKCATIAEAEMLALTGAPDVLLAYQPVGPKIKRLVDLITNYPATTFSCLVDNEETASEIATSASAQNTSIYVYLDLNVGMNRTGIAPENAFELYNHISRMPGIKLAGLHAYDGHITNPDFDTRTMECKEAYRKVDELSNEIVRHGFPRPTINTGSTPTLKLHAGNMAAECSPGTFIYWDQWYDELYKELPFKPAVLVVTRVISQPGPGTFCLDLGYKALSSEGNSEQRVRFLNAPDVKIMSQSEEHMLIKVTRNNLKIGDVLYGIPYHIGRTCNLYQSGSTVYNHQVNGQWIHFNGRKITI